MGDSKIKTGTYNAFIDLKSNTCGAHILFTDIKARSEQDAIKKAKAVLKENGFILVNDDALVMEVERVYETRWDCMADPEGVRRAA